ncbi:hypothetical protein [Streptomyces sp. SP18CS02]|uniref:hypothetical protein n=1 Tax=Streptomyces sp. SP18CS02 TaxID=3002531 RepID=UPI002E790D43|nr:hypothetical protein [Streptomyces sp. SP18CS02]MEE1756175.1 hypothetical protein [Streptomyces sp. SP18CS02]
MSLVELITQADERGLAASAVACLDRCLPLLDPAPAETLRPLWGAVAEGGAHWAGRLAEAGASLDGAAPTAGRTPEGGAPAGAAGTGPAQGTGADAAPGADAPSAGEAGLVREALGAAPADWAEGPLREWADACSRMALELHHRLEAAPSGSPAACRTGGTETLGPLVSGELRRQTLALEILAEGSPDAVRRVLDLSAEGQRVLRAVVSRRTRGGETPSGAALTAP